MFTLIPERRVSLRHVLNFPKRSINLSFYLSTFYLFNSNTYIFLSKRCVLPSHVFIKFFFGYFWLFTLVNFQIQLIKKNYIKFSDIGCFNFTLVRPVFISNVFSQLLHVCRYLFYRWETAESHISEVPPHFFICLSQSKV